MNSFLSQSSTNTQIQISQRQFSTSKTLKTKKQCLFSALGWTLRMNKNKSIPVSFGRAMSLIAKVILRTQV